jgi:TolB-like protein/tRNA A-37 threonylcarbamoyl transferase component Bud32
MSTPVDRLTAALADRYRLERELGQGGMATVYLAQDRKHDRQVAIKVLKPELSAVIGAERFLSEIKTTANLQHPNLLPLFDSGSADGLLYYVMPYIEGETLRARLVREPQLPIDETLRLLGLLAGALDFAHARGVVHRDLKPENILLQAGQPIIADFGIALAVSHAGGSRITETGLSLGTPHYMSPEQAVGDRAVDARSDQYALAAVTYEMLTGEPPHTGATAQAVIARLMSEAPRSMRTVRPPLSASLDHAVLRALAKAPADRFSSCGEFAAAAASAAGATTTITTAPAHRRGRLTAAGLVLGLAVAAAWWFTRAGNIPPAAAAEQSIAVLPLVIVGGDSTQEFFADGMTDELTTALGKVPGLRVAARTSALSFKGRRDLDVSEVGRQLGVGSVLQGTVRRAGERLRVSVQLIEARTRTERWSQSYDQGAADVFAVQDSITQAIAGQLALTLGGADLAATRAGRTTSPEAHDRYLQGLSLVHQGTESSLRSSLAYFEAALAIDPRYSQPYAGIAWAYAYLADAFMPGSVAYDSAAIAARKSIDLGNTTGETHVVLGYANYVRTWDRAQPQAEMRRGVDLSPNSADVRALYGNWLCLTGEFDAGIAQADHAIDLDRLSPIGDFVRDWCLYLARRHDDVIARHEAAGVRGQYLYLDTFLGAAYRERGRYEEALAEYRRAQTLAGELPLHGYAITYARMGRTTEARAILAQLATYSRTHYVNPLSVAAVHAALGESDRAFEWLERAVTDRTVLLAGLNFWPDFDTLHADPRFAALVRRVGLPEGNAR